jgi:hypothetical protein
MHFMNGVVGMNDGKPEGKSVGDEVGKGDKVGSDEGMMLGVADG